jgi:hypothetical protein
VASLGVASVDMDCNGANKDIEAFVSESLTRDVRFIRTPQEGKAMVRESLINRANGMYDVMASILYDDILITSAQVLLGSPTTGFRLKVLLLERLAPCPLLSSTLPG